MAFNHRLYADEDGNLDDTIPEYEYLDSTPTEGDIHVFVDALTSEVLYLTGGDAECAVEALEEGVTVGIDHWGAGTVRYLVTTSGQRIDQAG
jgi:hypothetical protein